MKIMRTDSDISCFITAAHPATIGTVRCLTAPSLLSNLLEDQAMWTKPEFTEMRFGFEVTMYIYNR
jgi:coenzyme PQQ precursor peptide PqqA